MPEETSELLKHCPECDERLEEKREQKRDVTGTWANYILAYCNNCRDIKDRKLGR